MKRFFALNAFLILFSSTSLLAAEKKFQRALILAGGGISPGVGLGIITAAEKRGWYPDVIIVTCGSALAALIHDHYPNAEEALSYAQSPDFKRTLEEGKLVSRNLLHLKKTFDRVKNNPDVIPPIFTETLLHFPLELTPQLKPKEAPLRHTPKIIYVSAEAQFTPVDVGSKIGKRKLFKETFFTDADTAQAIKDFKSPLAKFKDSYVDESVVVISDKSGTAAVRASVADPFLINPAEIDGKYYFTGAIDLFPIELAESLAEEVFTTYPSSLFKSFEDLAIESTFGFKQSDRMNQVLLNKTVKWIDMRGVIKTKFDPSPLLIYARYGIPKSQKKYAKGILRQYNFGSQRMEEALDYQLNGPQSTKHLRMLYGPHVGQ